MVIVLINITIIKYFLILLFEANVYGTKQFVFPRKMLATVFYRLVLVLVGKNIDLFLRNKKNIIVIVRVIIIVITD